jgi:formylmethanofuran dehydrogenase subunit E
VKNIEALTPLPVCEKCWLDSHTKWEPESIDREGNILMKLVNVKVPEKLNTKKAEICSECGEITVSGIYDIKDSNLEMFFEESDLETEREEH